MSRRTETRARLEGLGETAMAAMEDVGAQLRQLGAPETTPSGRWILRERYITTVRATPAIILFELDASYDWVTDDDDDTEEPF